VFEYDQPLQTEAKAKTFRLGSSSLRKVLVLALGRRGGSVQYGSAIIEQINLPKEIYVSSFCTEKVPENSIKIRTYRNKGEFFVSFFFNFLPLFFRVLVGLFRGEYLGLYLPYTHYWNAPFVATFRLFGLQTACTVHDGIPHTGDGNIWEAIINRFTIRQASHLIFLSRHVADFLQHKIGFSCHYSVIPHGILRAGVSRSDRIAQRPARLLFLGRVCHYKGVDLFLKGLEHLDDHLWERATIAGQIVPGLHFPPSTEKVSWENRWLNQEEVKQQLDQADILVLPYREATQSGVITLAIDQCLPMVCSRVGGLPEQLGEDDCIWVEPDPHSISKGLKDLISSPVIYQNHVSRLRDLKSNSSWSEIGKKIESLFATTPSP